MQKLKPIEYILVDIANSFGHDKLLWDERTDWATREVVPFILNQDEAAIEDLMADAKAPFLFRKACYAYEDALKQVPSGYMVGLDQTASGLQLFAVLTGCHKTAAAVNLINTGKREDVYQNVAEYMSKLAGKALVKDDLKTAIMTVFYGSKEEPKKIFGDGTELLGQFYTTLQEMLPGAFKALAEIQSLWRGDVLAHKWTTPDGHTSLVKVMKRVGKKIEIDELGGATYTYEIDVNEPSEYGISLLANYIHSLDGYLVREIVRRAKKLGFQVLCVHDCYFVHPNYANQLRQLFIDILCEMSQMDLMGKFASEILGQPVSYQKLTNDLHLKIADSEYGIC